MGCESISSPARESRDFPPHGSGRHRLHTRAGDLYVAIPWQIYTLTGSNTMVGLIGVVEPCRCSSPACGEARSPTMWTARRCWSAPVRPRWFSQPCWRSTPFATSRTSGCSSSWRPSSCRPGHCSGRARRRCCPARSVTTNYPQPTHSTPWAGRPAACSARPRWPHRRLGRGGLRGRRRGHHGRRAPLRTDVGLPGIGEQTTPPSLRGSPRACAMPSPARTCSAPTSSTRSCSSRCRSCCSPRWPRRSSRGHICSACSTPRRRLVPWSLGPVRLASPDPVLWASHRHRRLRLECSSPSPGRPRASGSAAWHWPSPGPGDMTSAVFRMTLWNQSIPENLRGRLAGIEMLSYSVGPLGAQIRAGYTADVGRPVEPFFGGVASVGVVLAAAALRDFWRYDARTDEHLLAERACRAHGENLDLRDEHLPRPRGDHADGPWLPSRRRAAALAEVWATPVRCTHLRRQSPVPSSRRPESGSAPPSMPGPRRSSSPAAARSD